MLTLIDIFFLNQMCKIYFRELSTSDAIVGTFIMKGWRIFLFN